MSANDFVRQDLGDGSAVFVSAYDEGLMKKAVESSLQDQTTPTPTDRSSKASSYREPGPIQRFNDVFTDIGSTYLEALGLDGFEIAKAIQTRRDEIFRNQFPLLLPRFEAKCTDCAAEYDSDVDECERCGSDDLRDPQLDQKLEAKRFFESVNAEGQSLTTLMEQLEGDHGRLGVAAMIVRYEYVTGSGDETVLGRPIVEEGEIIRKTPTELVRADPKRVVPVTDEDGRLGGWQWTCPLHRETALQENPGTCDECGNDLREVAFVERPYVRTRDVEKYYFSDEVITWANFFPRQHGLDGLSPVHHVWMKQAILHWMDVYAGAFYDPNSKKYPNKFMVVHTTNTEAWERNFREAQDEAEENLYANKIFVNEYAADSQSTPDLQVVDLMDDELMGQDQAIKKQYKSDIRTQWGVTDIFDSELEDAGGLNNEGLQLEVTDRHIAKAQHSLVEGPLDELMKRLGFDDWSLGFVPRVNRDLDELQQKVEIGKTASQAGLDAEWRDNDLQIPDGEFDAQADAGEGMGGLFASDRGDGSDDEGDAAGRDQGLAQAAETLTNGYEHLVWADTETKADPFWDADESVPERVKAAIQEAIFEKDAIFDAIDGVDATGRLKAFMMEKLTQPQGWSLESLTTDLEDRFGLSAEKAQSVARTESAAVLNNARESVFDDLEDDVGEELRYKWIGPSDDRTTEACEWLKAQTNPRFGGDPVPMDRLLELEREAQERFFPDLDEHRRHLVHPNERHTFTEAARAKADYDGSVAAGFPGTFEIA